VQQLQFGVTTAQIVPWSVLVQRWQYLERLGFDTVWLIDHIVPPRSFEPSQPFLESWTLLAALATQTDQSRLGVLTTNVLFRNPVLLVKQVVTVDHVSNGRLELALGSGNAAPSYPMAGIAAGTVADRVGRLQEVVEIVDRLFREDVTTYQGRYYQIQEVQLRPKPVQHPRPPLTVGAHRSATLKVAAAYADKWNSFGGFGVSPRDALEATRRRSEQLDQYCAALGRDPHTITRSFVAGFTRDPLWSSMDAFEDFIGRYREIGISEFLFRWPQDDQLSMFERVACERLPALRLPAVSPQGAGHESRGSE